MLYWVCLLSPLLFLFNTLVIGLVTPDYNARTTAISQLVHYRYGVLQVLNFLICGILSLGLAYYVHKMNAVPPQEKLLVMTGAIAFGLSLLLVGIFKTDVGGTTSVAGHIHSTTFISSVLVQGVVQLLFARHRLPDGVGIYFAGSGLVTLFGLGAMSVLPGIRGLAQRILVLAIALWVTFGPVLLRK
jgi:hypothetical protein